MRGILFYIIIFFLLVLQINAQPPCGNPAPPPVDFCQAACVLCDLSQIDGYTGTSGSFTSDGPAVCGMSVENNQWFAFMAISSSVSLTINSTGCSSGDGIQAVLFSGTCNALSVVDCQVSGPSSSQTITGNGLTVGDVYYVSIDGWAGAVCGFTVTVNYGAGNISVGNAGPITGPTIMCANGEGTYTISPVAGASEYTWTIPPGATINGSPGPQTLPAGSGESVTITFGANAAGQICVTPKNACNVGVPSCLTILPKIIPPTILPPVQICSGECLTWIDGNDYCFPGLLSKTFKTPEGCDSVVQQMVTLLPPIINNLGTIFLCENECIEINGNNYCWPGFNTEIATSNIPPYCDSTILFNIVQVLPDAEIDAFPSTEITCNNSQITLSSIGISIPSGSVQYNWLLNGFPYSNTPNINTSTSGNYTLIIQNSLGTTTCFDTADITITQNIIPPSISLNAPILPCTGSIVIDLSTNATNVSYQWSGPDINTTNQNLQDPAISLPGTYFVTVTNTTNGCTNSASINITQTQGGTANISSFLDASCSNTCDGIATANITGGVAPYSYNWSGPTPQTSSTAVNLCPGSYTVSITDNQGCVATANVNIGSPLALSFTESIVDEKCNQENGEICISNVSGGTSPYYFNWTGFASTDTCLGNLGSGDYYLTIFDENNCSISDTFILENIAGPTIQASINQEISCYNACDGILTVNVNGGTAPYIYNWNDPLSQTNQQINNICSGNYIITVTDIYNCYATDTIQLNQPDSFSINTSTINADCNTPNGQACVYVSGGTPPYLYLWNDINAQTANCANGLLPGIYEVQITDQNNCSKTVTVTVNANNAAIVNVLNTSNNLCFNSCDGTLEAIATGGTPPL